MGTEKSDHVKIDVEALSTNLEKMLDSNKSLFMSLECCIFPVPTILSRHNPRAYVPNAFSIGPFHYKKQPIMEGTQKIKLKYLHELISRPWKSEQHNENNPEARLRSLTKAVTDVQKDARACYTGWQIFDPTEFVEVLVLDGCFLIELFRRKAYKGQLADDQDDPIFSMSCLLQFLYHDLILLENQIPWLVMDSLFEITKTDTDKTTLVELVVGFFGNIFSNGHPPLEEPLLSNLKKSKHILDLLRNSLVLPSEVKEEISHMWQPMPSATSLMEAGIKFSASRETTCILDIKFRDDGVIEIPPLLVQETTESVLRNLICLEQCCPNYKPIITSYAVIMDNLINTDADTQILCKRGAIQNWLNTEDATKLFNKLYEDTYVKGNCYHKLTADVNAHCKRRWPKWRKVLMRDYFSHPWSLISIIAATILLVVTIVQTVFTIIK